MSTGTNEQQTEAEEQPLTSIEQAQLDSLNAMIGIRNFYHEPRLEGELDLIKEVRQVMLEKGVSIEALERVYDKHPIIIESADKHAPVQQHNLSRFFNEQLLCHQGLEKVKGNEVDTRLQRYQLLNEVTPSEYLKVISVSVIPVMAELDLPKDFFYADESQSSGTTDPETT